MAVDPRKVSYAENTYDERPVRPCLACGQSDRAPKDVVGLPNGQSITFHFDCHSMMGCMVCAEMLEKVGKGKKNEDLWLNLLEEGQKSRDKQADVMTRDDVSGDYQKALDEGRMVDNTWNGKA